MIIIPTIDILDGYVVQRRPEPPKYRRLESVLVNSAEPIFVLHAIKEKLGCNTFYVTDLNARHRQGNNFQIINDLSKVENAKLLVDVGISTPKLGRKLLKIGATKVVVGVKHLVSLKEALRIIEAVSMNNVIFAIEMEQYQLYTNSAEIRKMDPIKLINQLRIRGLEEFVVFELSNIGTAGGIPLDFIKFIRKIFQHCPRVKIITGGGIHNAKDLIKLKNLGVSGCLVGTALHSGTITAQDIHNLSK